MQKMHDRRNIGKIVIDPLQEPKPKPVETEAETESRTSSLRWRKFSTKDKDDAASDSKKQSATQGTTDNNTK